MSATQAGDSKIADIASAIQAIPGSKEEKLAYYKALVAWKAEMDQYISLEITCAKKGYFSNARQPEKPPNPMNRRHLGTN